jgi:ferredoxin-thioredoxin reductase catalytic subunit
MTFEENLERIKKIAVEKKLTLNSDEERIKKVIGLMADNYKNHGYHFCPCKQKNEIPKKDKDTICPCPELDKEIQENGQCGCRIFFDEQE